MVAMPVRLVARQQSAAPVITMSSRTSGSSAWASRVTSSTAGGMICRSTIGRHTRPEKVSTSALASQRG